MIELFNVAKKLSFRNEHEFAGMRTTWAICLLFYGIENSRNGIRSTFTFAIHIISPSFSFWISSCNDHRADGWRWMAQLGCFVENNSQKKLFFIRNEKPCAEARHIMFDQIKDLRRAIVASQ